VVVSGSGSGISERGGDAEDGKMAACHPGDDGFVEVSKVVEDGEREGD